MQEYDSDSTTRLTRRRKNLDGNTRHLIAYRIYPMFCSWSREVVGYFNGVFVML